MDKRVGELVTQAPAELLVAARQGVHAHADAAVTAVKEPAQPARGIPRFPELVRRKDDHGKMRVRENTEARSQVAIRFVKMLHCRPRLVPLLRAIELQMKMRKILFGQMGLDCVC